MLFGICQRVIKYKKMYAKLALSNSIHITCRGIDNKRWQFAGKKGESVKKKFFKIEQKTKKKIFTCILLQLKGIREEEVIWNRKKSYLCFATRTDLEEIGNNAGNWVD